jgi:hypothetical protein
MVFVPVARDKAALVRALACVQCGRAAQATSARSRFPTLHISALR